MKQFVFAGNRQRWPRLRPLVKAAAVVIGLWVAALTWTLLKTPSLSPLPLRRHVSRLSLRGQTAVAQRPNLWRREAGR